jgi:hypothetical protein
VGLPAEGGIIQAGWCHYAVVKWCRIKICTLELILDAIEGFSTKSQRHISVGLAVIAQNRNRFVVHGWVFRPTCFTSTRFHGPYSTTGLGVSLQTPNAIIVGSKAGGGEAAFGPFPALGARFFRLRTVWKCGGVRLTSRIVAVTVCPSYRWGAARNQEQLNRAT